MQALSHFIDELFAAFPHFPDELSAILSHFIDELCRFSHFEKKAYLCSWYAYFLCAP